MIYKRSKNGGVAQLGERTVRIRKVESSILFVSTITQKAEHLAVFCFLFFLCFHQVANTITAVPSKKHTIPHSKKPKLLP